MLGVDGPAHVARDDLAIVGRIGDARAAPVLGIDEVGTLESFLLVVFHTGVAHEQRVEFVAFRVGDDEVYIGSTHPLGKRVGDGLRQRTAMGSPREHHFRTGNGLVFLNRDKVGKGLKRVHGGRFHRHNGLSAVLHKLLHDGFGIVVVAVGESGKRADGDDVAIGCHHGNGLEQVLTLVAVHDDASFGLQFPGTLVHVEHDDVHAKVHGCLLRGEACAERIIEEYEQRRFVTAEMLPLETVALHFLRFLEGNAKVADVLYMLENSHLIKFCFKFQVSSFKFLVSSFKFFLRFATKAAKPSV